MNTIVFVAMVGQVSKSVRLEKGISDVVGLKLVIDPGNVEARLLVSMGCSSGAAVEIEQLNHASSFLSRWSNLAKASAVSSFSSCQWARQRVG